MQRIATIGCALVLTGLFTLGVWFRVSSLASMPGIDADEAWYAVQVHNGLSGKPFQAFTPYANPLNPLFSGLHVPFLLTSKPSLTLLRVPAALCGLLAVGLCFYLVRRAFDRTTALIASAGLAVMPVAIVFSRIGYDVCQTPLFILLAVYFALRANKVGLVLSFIACFLVHPTNVFVLPVLLLVFLVQELKKYPRDRAKQWRVGLLTLSVPAALALTAGVVILRRPELKEMHEAVKGPALGHHDLAHFLRVCRQLFLGMSVEPPGNWALAYDLAFWAVSLGVVLPGAWLLARRGEWERVALIAGTFASGVVFFIVAGSDAICATWVSWLRYGLFLLVPSILAFAVAARVLLTESAPMARPFQVAGLLGLGAALLVSAKVNCFDVFLTNPSETVWTLQTETKTTFSKAFSILRGDARRSGRTLAGGTVITDDHWVQRPIQYLSNREDGLDVVPYDVWLKSTDRNFHKQLLTLYMGRGAYVVCTPRSPLETDLRGAFPPERLESWDVRESGQLKVYRLKADTPPSIANAGVAPAATR